jgi:hypothetical protein
MLKNNSIIRLRYCHPRMPTRLAVDTAMILGAFIEFAHILFSELYTRLVIYIPLGSILRVVLVDVGLFRYIT